MTNREYVNQMTDKELAQWVIDMYYYCERWLAITHDPKEKNRCIKSWLGRKRLLRDDNKDTPQRIHYNLVSKTESVLDEIKERFPDTEITIEAPLGKSTTVRLKDANIYVAVNNSRLALCA